MLIENMVMALHAIRANKMRSFLTMLGIIIGIGSVIAVVSIGDSMRAMIANLYKDVGVTQAYFNVDWSLDDFRMSDYFTLDDIERVKEVFGEDVAYIDSSAGARTEGTYGRNRVKFNMQGIDYNYTDVQPMNIISGRALNQGDILDRRKNVVLEAKGAEMLFGTANAAGKTFRATVNKETSEYKVVGVYKKKESPLAALMMGSGEYQEAYVPYTILTSSNDFFSQLHVYAAENINLNEFYDRLRRFIAKSKGRQPENIRYFSAKDEMGSMDAMMGGLSGAVGGIAAISLLVGGIGIMNIMLVSVTERTREIGIRKALGAKTRDVLIQFLTESAILSAFGGIIGVILGAGSVMIGGSLLGMTVVIKPFVVLVAVGFSAAVGVFFGLYPASKAASKDPIEALRFE